MQIARPFIEETNAARIVFSENKSKLIFLNPQHKLYQRIQVDGKVITVGARCDYLLRKVDVTPNEEYFVELKGKDISHAIEQLEATIKLLSVDAKSLEKIAFVIATKVAPAENTRRQVAAVKFKKEFKAELIVKTREYEHRLK